MIQQGAQRLQDVDVGRNVYGPVRNDAFERFGKGLYCPNRDGEDEGGFSNRE
jgi:hypothetical protein